MATLFEDERFQDLLLTLAIKDRQFLKDCHRLLDPKDFVAVGSNGFNARAAVAKMAIAHYEKYREPIADLLSSEVSEYSRKRSLEGRRLRELSEFAETILARKPKVVQSITDKVVQYKRDKLKAAAVQNMIGLHEKGELSDDKWLEISRAAINVLEEDPIHVADLFAELSLRIDRRKYQKQDRFPALLIDPLDAIVRAIARGHVGLVLAPWKRGKSMLLIHIAVAYVLQRLNVLFITLEDPQEDVEDRFDACIAQLPMKKLNTMPKTLRQRFKNFVRLTRSRIRIIDGTERSISMRTVEEIWDDQRAKGFAADATIIDYDDEIKPAKRYSERRMEFAEIYRDMRKFASTKHQLVWTAAQTRKGTDQVKVLTGDHLAEDVSKIRKVSMAIGMGQGDWGDESLYLNVAAHKFDKQHIGCHIIPDKERMLIYSRERTLKYQRRPKKEEDNSVEDEL